MADNARGGCKNACGKLLPIWGSFGWLRLDLVGRGGREAIVTHFRLQKVVRKTLVRSKRVVNVDLTGKGDPPPKKTRVLGKRLVTNRSVLEAVVKFIF